MTTPAFFVFSIENYVTYHVASQQNDVNPEDEFEN